MENILDLLLLDFLPACMFSPSYISCINVPEKCESIALDIGQIKLTGPTGSCLSCSDSCHSAQDQGQT